MECSLQASTFQTHHTYCLIWCSQLPQGWICQTNEEVQAPKQESHLPEPHSQQDVPPTAWPHLMLRAPASFLRL